MAHARGAALKGLSIVGLFLGLLASAERGSAQPFTPLPDTISVTARPVPYDEGMAAIMQRGAILGATLRRGAHGQIQLQTQATLTPADEELVLLARALRHDPDLIYEHVYNTIETLPQFGSLKGPLGTLLDGKGTAFDQAELMAVLLKEAGYAPVLMVGRARFTAAQLSAWLGTDTSYNSISTLIGFGGFPADFNQSGDGQIISADISWAWVSVQINGTSYVFDPAGKTYSRTAGIAPSFAGMMGYNQSIFLDRALSGATAGPTLPGVSIANINRANIRADLANFSGSLRNSLRSQYPAAGPVDVLGGAVIVPLPLNTRQRLTSLPNQTPGSTPTTYPDGLPDSLRARLTITIPGASPATFNSSDIYGRRLSLFFTSDAQPRPLLSLEGQVLVTGSPVPTNTDMIIPTAITHPYTSDFADQPQAGQSAPTLKVKPSPGGAFIIGNGWGQIGRGMIERHRRILLQNTTAHPGNPSAEPVLGESLAMLSYTWLAQRARVQQLVDQLANTATLYHHAVGITGMQAPVGGVTGPYVDLPLNIVALAQRIGRDASAKTPAEESAFFVGSHIASVLESGAIEQTQPIQTAVSTVKLLDISSESGLTYDINNGAIPGNDQVYYQNTIRPMLVPNYNTSDLQTIDNLVGRNLRIILPYNGKIQVNNWIGVGYFNITQTLLSVGAAISGGLHGGAATVNQPPPAFNASTVVSAPPQSSSQVATTPGASQGNSAGFFQTIGDPLNQVTGDYVYSHDDLAVGSSAFPYGLGFQRSYDSGRSISTAGPLGLGWTHNFDYTVQPDSDGFEGMAATSPSNSAAALAALYVLQDIFYSTTANSKPLDRMMIGVVVARWMMDSLTGNVIRVAQPGLTESFVRDPAATYGTPTTSGSYGAPIGSGSTLTANADGTFTYVAKDRTALKFGAASATEPGRVTSWANAAGVRVDFTYDGTKLIGVSNSLQRSLILTYTGDRLSSVSDGTGRNATFGYDTANRLVTYQDPMGQVTAFTYDGTSGRLAEIRYPSNPSRPFVANTYDSLGRITDQYDGSGNRTQVFIAGRRTELEDATGSRSAWYYTPLGRPYAEVRDFGYDTSGTPRLNLATRHVYDGQARRVQTTQPEGNSISLTYSPDMRQNIIATIETAKPGSPLPSRTRSFTYEPTWNRVTSMIDARGTVTTYAYDGRGNLAQTVADAGTGRLNLTASAIYDDAGRVQSATDASGVTTQYSYDATSNLVAIIADVGSGRLNQTTRFSYDAVGNALSRTDPNGNTTTTTYDLARRPLVATAPPPFDSGSNLVRTITGYDPDGRVISVTRTNGAAPSVTARIEYTNSGQVLARIDPNGNRSVFAYDGADRLQRVTIPVAFGIGRSTSYAYDRAGRLVQVTDNAGNAAEAYVYTANSQRARFTNARSAATDFTYDGFDRLVQTQFPMGSTGTRTTELFTWDPGDNMLSRTTRAGAVISFGYDAVNRLVSKTPPAPAPAVTYVYDSAGRPTSIRDTSAAIAVATPPSPGTTVRYATSWSYDRLNRLTATSWDNAPAQQVALATGGVTFTHAYNGANQRTGGTTTNTGWWNVPAATPSVVAYTANPADQYTAVGSVTPTHDANGNLTFDGTYSYGYDVENRLVSVSQGGSAVATYAYDAQGRRKLRTAGGVTTLFVTDPDGREVLEYRGSDGQVQRWYAYGAGPNEVLARMEITANTRATYIPDGLGSVLAAYASDTGARTLRTYRPFGEGAGTAFPFAFTGQRLDAEAGNLHYFRARHYHPALGRFTQTDPIGYAGGANLYAYVGNDPLNFTDPSGLLAGQVASYVANLLPPADPNQYAATGAAAGGVAGAIVGGIGGGIGGGVGGTLVAPGVGTVGGAYGGAVAGTIEGVVAGASLGGAIGYGVGSIVYAAQQAANPAPDFVVTSGGTAIPVPRGATGPTETRAPGAQYTGGSGGPGLDPRVTGVRIMEGNANQGARVVYMNRSGQTVNPSTGRTVPNSDPFAHIYLGP